MEEPNTASSQDRTSGDGFDAETQFSTTGKASSRCISVNERESTTLPVTASSSQAHLSRDTLDLGVDGLDFDIDVDEGLIGLLSPTSSLPFSTNPSSDAQVPVYGGEKISSVNDGRKSLEVPSHAAPQTMQDEDDEDLTI